MKTNLPRGKGNQGGDDENPEAAPDPKCSHVQGVTENCDFLVAYASVHR